MFKQRLFTPGPTPVPEEVLMELARPIFHHRTPEYRKMLEQLTADMKYVLGTSQDVYTITGSGTAAMEASVACVVAPGEKMISVRGGKFGERWSELGNAFGATVVNLDVEWGTPVTPQMIADALKANPDAVAVYITQCETSTATVSDVEAIAREVAKTPALLVVDGISSIAAVPFKMDAWGVDIAVTGSQKALMLPPGLAFIACSAKAWKKIEATQGHAYYVNLKAYRKALAPPEWDNPYTPNNLLVRAACKALAMIRAEGLEKIWAETHKRAEAIRAAARALGLEVYSKAPSDSVTAIVVPEGMDGEALPKMMSKEFGVKPAGGQGKLKGKIIRFTTMGYTDAWDILAAVGALEMALARLGRKVDFGAGVAAAMKVLAG
ncbi:MAG: alanine--glyoxylate aminotransferase family protein [Planctomycetes bacterium]|nr:alanine--glyoxylate aminotransferase family protein [Planctomycetota bacterium]